MFSWTTESRGIQVWSFCNRVLCASGVQLDVEANRLVRASSGCRYASKAILSTSFFCGYGLSFILWKIVFCDCSMLCFCGHGLAFILWRLCFLIVPIQLIQPWSFTAFSVRAAFNWIFYKRIVWSEPQVNAEMH